MHLPADQGHPQGVAPLLLGMLGKPVFSQILYLTITVECSWTQLGLGVWTELTAVSLKTTSTRVDQRWWKTQMSSVLLAVLCLGLSKHLCHELHEFCDSQHSESSLQQMILTLTCRPGGVCVCWCINWLLTSVGEQTLTGSSQRVYSCGSFFLHHQHPWEPKMKSRPHFSPKHVFCHECLFTTSCSTMILWQSFKQNSGSSSSQWSTNEIPVRKRKPE